MKLFSWFTNANANLNNDNTSSPQSRSKEDIVLTNKIKYHQSMWPTAHVIKTHSKNNIENPQQSTSNSHKTNPEIKIETLPDITVVKLKNA